MDLLEDGPSTSTEEEDAAVASKRTEVLDIEEIGSRKRGAADFFQPIVRKRYAALQGQ